MRYEDLTPEEQAEVDRNSRTEAIARWAFTAFCALVVILWFVWPVLT
jgi:hypothetical protein